MIKVFVMQTCPDCASIKQQAQGDTRFQIIDIGEHVRNLKQFLALRDTNPAFDKVRQRGSVGIPCFVLEDGTIRPIHFYIVDTSEFAANKLGDRGSLAAKGIISNVQDFMRNLARGLDL